MFDFKGLEDWVEVFAAGKQTDSKGVEREFTTADLDEMIANHSAATPHVITHDELYSPFAYGWGHEVKRAGDKLLMRSDQVNPDFSKLLEDGALKERSVRISKGSNGWELQHVAWLGAQPPAVQGLAPVSFSAADEATFDFSSITQTQTKDAPMFTQEQLDEATAKAAATAAAQAKTDADSAYQAQLDKQATDHKAAMAAKDAEFKKSADEVAAKEFQQVLDTALKEGRLTPAQARGAPEFAASLPAETFDFSASEGKTEAVAPRQWLSDFMANLPKQLNMGDPGAEGESSVDVDDAEAVAAKAVEYQREQAAKGVIISASAAVSHVSKEAKP